jgi:hypothetical protein
VAAVYNRYTYADEKQHGLEALGRFVKGLANCKPSPNKMQLRQPQDDVEGNQLLDKLAEAQRVFTNESEEDGQALIIHALHDHLTEMGIEPRLLQPLHSLQGLLADADRKGAEKPLSKTVHMVLAAVALDTLIKAGLRVDAAARAVVKTAGEAMTAKQLITYRQNLHRKRARPEAVDMYWEMIRQSGAKWGHLSNKEQIVEALTGVHKTVVPGKKR